MLTTCPKCGCSPLPTLQTAYTTCPSCGVYLAKVAPRPPQLAALAAARAPDKDAAPRTSPLLRVPSRVDPMSWWLRLALLIGLGIWSGVLIGMDYRDGSIASSFIYKPLLVFHEAGHVIFMPFGEWLHAAGGSLFQLIVPAVMLVALLRKGDPFGAAVGLWLLGVSLLALAPYIYDAWDAKLMLLGGKTGEDGGHDWIYLLRTLGLRHRAQAIGAFVHKLGALVVLLALVWGGELLNRQRARFSDDVLFED